MTEFVGHAIGSRHYSYPETPRGAGALAFARNFAVGPSDPQTITTAGEQITWGTVDVAGPTFNDVPITPRVSGVVIVRGVVMVTNTNADPGTAQVQVQIDGVTFLIPASEVVIVPSNVATEGAGGTAIPILVEITGLTLGTSVNIQVLVTSSEDLSLSVNSSTLDVQEVLAATG